MTTPTYTDERAARELLVDAGIDPNENLRDISPTGCVRILRGDDGRRVSYRQNGRLRHVEAFMAWPDGFPYAEFAELLASTEPAGADPLKLPIVDEDNVGAKTVGDYLAALLTTLLDEEEGFSGKRPLGNSGWIGYIEDALGAEELDLTDLKARVREVLA